MRDINQKRLITQMTEYPKDWEAQQILERIYHNYNSDFCIYPMNEGIQTQIPRPIEKDTIKEVIKLFEDGAELLMHSYPNPGDDGGDCYMAYIQKANSERPFQLNMGNESWEPLDVQLMDYIIRNQDQIICIWAGPY